MTEIKELKREEGLDPWVGGTCFALPLFWIYSWPSICFNNTGFVASRCEKEYILIDLDIIKERGKDR